MRPVSAIGKYLDQPLLTAKLNSKVPWILAAGAGGITAKNINESPKEEKTRIALRDGLVLFSTALSAIAAPKIASKITGRKATQTLKEVKVYNKELVRDYYQKNVNSETKTIAKKAETKVLSLKEVANLFSADKEFADKLIPPPENITSKDIFKEIGWLSIYGVLPVAGGITGGIAADKLTDSEWKEKVPNKINEGMYQYLANIFLCNIGAGTALGILEKLDIKSKAARCIGMVSGILATGVIGGSMIANYIGNKFINPVILHKDTKENRTPEVLDLSLHTDDIATVSLLSGLKWIEPSLPLLYSVSGYRAGIGYRNNIDKKKNITEK